MTGSGKRFFWGGRGGGEYLVFNIPYLLDQKPRLIFSSRSRGRPLFESGYNLRAATILFINTKLSTSTSICVLFCIFHNPQFKSSIKTSFLLGGSHTYQRSIRRSCYYVRTLRAIIIIKASRGYYSRAATILLSSAIEFNKRLLNESGI